MEELGKIRYFYQLKSVYRVCSVGQRKESSAEHTWSCLVLADYFLSKMKHKLDKQKIFDMLLYHDIVEIETGDLCISKEKERIGKEDREKKALEIISKKVPSEMSRKIVALFQEFQEQKTMEAKFCLAVDYLDAEIHEMDYKEDWKGWTEEFLRKKKQHLYDEFPEMMELFEEATMFAREKGYFKQ